MAVTTKPKTGGDDLDDYLELDPNLVASGSDVDSDEDNDDDGEVDEDDLDVEGDGDRPVLDDDGDEGLGMNEGVKRKVDEVVDGDTDDEGEGRVGAGVAGEDEERRKRKREKTKERKAKRLANAPETPKLTPPTHLQPEDFLALLRTSLLSTHPSLTPMEITDRLPPVTSLLSAPEHKAPDLPRESFEPLRRRVAGLLKKGGKIQKGRPRIVVLCISGLRCIEVMNHIKDLKGDAQVAKLFAKHIKAPEQKKFLESTPVSIAVGTPARVGLFLADGTISVDKSTILLLDIGHQDSKTRTLLTMPEMRVELWKSIFGGGGRKALLEGGARIGAF